MFKSWKSKLDRSREIRYLKRYIDQQISAAVSSANNQREKSEAEHQAVAECYEEIDRLRYLQQKDVLDALQEAPFSVPDEYWYTEWGQYRKLLQEKYVPWARHELRKIRQAEIEFWFKMIVPILALIISILALTKNSH